jgi:hypothetical protein
MSTVATSATLTRDSNQAGKIMGVTSLILNTGKPQSSEWQNDNLISANEALP